MFNYIKNLLGFGYKNHPEAIVIACYFNPQNSPYRLWCFNEWYKKMKYVNHKIVEVTIKGSKPQLNYENVEVIDSDSFLWHKESTLNYIINNLPKKYKYVFWSDADIILTNRNWLVEGVNELKTNNIIQPFQYCVHLEKDELKPSFDLSQVIKAHYPNVKNKKVWRSFSATYVNYPILASSLDYNTYGHVGFIWGARRDKLEQCDLFDKALVGGADHVMALGSVGKFNHPSMLKSFKDDMETIDEYQKKFYNVMEGKISFVKGEVYHLWHGDLEKRQYLKRIQDFTPIATKIKNKDKNGLYITNDLDKYVMNYFMTREIIGNNEYFDNILNNNESIKESEFGGGDFGGGGASGDYGNETDKRSDFANENFS